MNKLETLSFLTSAWMAMGALTLARAQDSTAGNEYVRPSRALPNVSAAEQAATAARPLQPRPHQVGPRADHPTGDGRQAFELPASDQRYSRVYWDTDEHGTIWVRGRQYKASFGADGATYYPLFGSKQPKHYPLQLSLGSVTSGGGAIDLAPKGMPERDGDKVIFHRGPVDEVYEVGVESLEQSLVIRERPQGDMTLSIDLHSEMARSEGVDGLRFTNELGSVHYSRAFVREANGTQRALATCGVEDGARIDLDAETTVDAQFPLVVDPVLTTIPVNTSVFENYTPDVAYDASTDHYLFVFTEFASAFDEDVYCELFSGAGALLSGHYADHTTQAWSHPAVANLNAYDQFMVVAIADPTPTSGGGLVGRLTGANALGFGATFTIENDPNRNLESFSVGGDSFVGGPANYCVVMGEFMHPSIQHPYKVTARLVTNTGALVGSGPTVIGDSMNWNGAPKVSKGDASFAWNIAWGRGPDGYTGLPGGGASWSPQPQEIWGAQMRWDGVLLTSAFPISTASHASSRPVVSSPLTASDFMVAWEEDYGTDHDIVAARVLGNSVLQTSYLTQLEDAGNLFDDQIAPEIDADSDRFVLSYQEQQLGHWATRVSSFGMVNGSVHLLDSHVRLSADQQNAGTSAVVSNKSTGGVDRKFALTWDTHYVGDDIAGALFRPDPISTYCFGDGSGTSCPCGNNGGAGRGCASSVNASGAHLIGQNTASVSGDTVTLQASGLPTTTSCLFFQGTTSGANGGLGAVFGDGLRCTGGTTIRLGAETSVLGFAIYPDTGDTHVSVHGAIPAAGAIRYYQAWYRNSGVFCTASTFNMTNGVKIAWLP